MTTVAARIASILQSAKNGHAKATETLETILKDAPSGSGFDAGTKFDLDGSTPNKLLFDTSFHHMSEHGFYDGWSEHRVTVRPSFIGGFDVTISGRDRNEIKDYIAEIFDDWLGSDCTV